jgi:hypothetical protein
VQVLVPDAERPDQTEPLKTPLTVHNLLTHTAGLTYGFNQDILSEAYAKPSRLRPAGRRPRGNSQSAGCSSPCCSSRAAVGTIPLQPMSSGVWSRWFRASRSTGSSKTTFSAPWR